MKKNKYHSHLLKQLANLYGIQTSYEDVFDLKRQTTDEALFYLLKAMNSNIEKETDVAIALEHQSTEYWTQKIEPVIVIWENAILNIPIRLTEQEALKVVLCRLQYENGTSFELTIDLSLLPTTQLKTMAGKNYVFKMIQGFKDIPYGYHRLTITLDEKTVESFIISAPANAYQKMQCSSFGLFVPLYSLQSDKTWGCGDLSLFKEFMEWTKEQGGRFVSTLPLQAAFLEEPFEPSPYSPMSKLFWNELYLDLNDMLEGEPNKMTNDIHLLNQETWVNYKKIMHIKRQLLTDKAKITFDSENHYSKLQNYLTENPQVKDYALFRSTMEIKQKNWSVWGEAEKNGKISHEYQNTSNYQYHVFSQWQMEEQLKNLNAHAKSKDMLLLLDMPLGVHKEGYDTWKYQAEFALNASVGAPPDAGFPKGQNWGFPPLHPERMRKLKYQYYIQSLRTIMKHVNILRIDHVMSLHRLFWIPNGAEPSQGAYLRYFSEELYAILCLESLRNNVILIGENLGTIPSYVNETLKKRRLTQMYILQYELDSNHDLSLAMSKNTLSSLNTHDMPTFSGYVQAYDIEAKVKFKLLARNVAAVEKANRKTHVENLKKELLTKGYLNNNVNASLNELLTASLKFLAHNESPFLQINLEDLWLEHEPQNIPSADAETNWRRKTKFKFEEFSKNKQVLTILAAISSVYKISLITDEDVYLFNEGNHFRLYQKLGAHGSVNKEKPGVYFAVFAPNAHSVSVIGDFNQWNFTKHPLYPRGASGIFEGFIPNITKGSLYKYYIQSNYNHYKVEKADPFGFFHEVSPHTASVVWDLEYDWKDEDWMQHRKSHQNFDKPISIYEMHLGSWRRHGEDNTSLSYREMAIQLPPYLKEMGYTHVEFLPLMEHPFFGSWGYQQTGYFAPSSRYGTPQDFMYLIDVLHQNDIGVILDWVPSHFPDDQHGLIYFDGTHLFEHLDPKQRFHPEWNSVIFNYGRNEVRAFLISSALFWLDKYHVDGLRVDAVASMLYLDYLRKEGEWVPNQYGGRENLEAIFFLRQFNEVVYRYYPEVHTIAEESSVWEGVTKPTNAYGLGFGFKWDMGWMHDTLSYLSHDPLFRRHHYNEMTFRMLYAFSENFVLPLSHDEVVYGKGSLLSRMPGSEWDKFANLRILLGYLYTQPGKKLLFMGSDFGQWSEWNHDSSLDWHLLQFPMHQGIQKWVKILNKIYTTEKALHELDCNAKGFEWVECNDKENCILIFLRKASLQSERILVVINTIPLILENYRIGVPIPGFWIEVVNSDDLEYGGQGLHNEGISTEPIPFHNHSVSLTIRLPPLSIMLFKWQEHTV